MRTRSRRAYLIIICVLIAFVVAFLPTRSSERERETDVAAHLLGRDPRITADDLRALLPTPKPTPKPTPRIAPNPRSADRGSQQAAPVEGHGAARTVHSTAYCLTGTMKNGQRVYNGAVAVTGAALASWAPMGSRWRVLSGPATGRVLTVADRIGHGSEFDIAMPGRCGDALQYGSRTIRISRA